jgi:gluconate 2-dehydrogenase gamma chain
MTSRRDAVRALAGIAALPLFGKLGAQDVVEVGRRAHELAELTTSPRALTAAEFEMVSEAAELIIPRTDTPGATDARVAHFIDVMLADWYEAADRDRFRAGLSELDARARKATGRGFAQMERAKQIEVLETLDRELSVRRQAREDDADETWFAMLKHLTVWGYYTSRPGIVEELRVQLVTGRYEGNARY